MKNSKKWYVYIIQTHSGKLYTGITVDLDRRFSEHSKKQNSKGAKFFRSQLPKKIVFKEEYLNRSEAKKEKFRLRNLVEK